MAPKSRNETENRKLASNLRFVSRETHAEGAGNVSVSNLETKQRNPQRSFQISPILPPNAGKYRHFRLRLHRAVFYFTNYAVSKRVLHEFRLFRTASEISVILFTIKQPPRENYLCEMRIRDLRTKPKKRDSVPQCFVSRSMKRPGIYAGLFRETKRRRKSCFVSVVSLPTCFNSGPTLGTVVSICTSVLQCNTGTTGSTVQISVCS